MNQSLMTYQSPNAAASKTKTTKVGRQIHIPISYGNSTEIEMYKPRPQPEKRQMPMCHFLTDRTDLTQLSKTNKFCYDMYNKEVKRCNLLIKDFKILCDLITIYKKIFDDGSMVALYGMEAAFDTVFVVYFRRLFDPTNLLLIEYPEISIDYIKMCLSEITLPNDITIQWVGPAGEQVIEKFSEIRMKAVIVTVMWYTYASKLFADTPSLADNIELLYPYLGSIFKKVTNAGRVPVSLIIHLLDTILRRQKIPRGVHQTKEKLANMFFSKNNILDGKQQQMVNLFLKLN